MTSEPPRLPWPNIDPTEWLRTWQTVWRLAPDNLAQSILQGWTLNINSNNSAAPQTEVDVVARYSYGRQLGRIGDAVQALIDQAEGRKPNVRAFTEFAEMQKDIERVKSEAAARRVKRLGKDLAALKVANPKEFERIRKQLRNVLGE